MDTQQIAAAKNLWSSLTPRKQMRIAEQIVEARSQELKRAYPGTRYLAYGYRTRRRHGKYAPVNEICVTFIVEKKWASLTANEAHAADAIPQLLFTHVPTPNRRRARLCAVPTDVEDLTQHGAVAQSPIIVKSPNATEVIRERGHVTAPVAVDGSDVIYGLGCQHVISMSPYNVESPLNPLTDLSVRSYSDESVVLARFNRGVSGDLPSYFGTLLSNQEVLSFDAALFPFGSAEKARSAFNQLRIEKRATDHFILRGQALTIKTGRGDIKGSFVQLCPKYCEIEYFDQWEKTIVPNPRHRLLLEIELPKQQTEPGDSGAPILDENGTLVAMHIAGNKNTKRSFAVPADMLFIGDYYSAPQIKLRLANLS